ncbi:MAG: NAD-dependent epimerase/dehydratase family protein, partial [Bacteroidota bacterium]
MNKSSKIYIAGHKGMVGGAIWSALQAAGYKNLIGKSSSELDLRNQQAVRDFFATEKPDIVVDAAARVGGILANNDYPFTFLMENMQIQNNLIDTSLHHNVEKFIFLGSSCIYPK